MANTALEALNHGLEKILKSKFFDSKLFTFQYTEALREHALQPWRWISSAALAI